MFEEHDDEEDLEPSLPLPLPLVVVVVLMQQEEPLLELIASFE
jgi:hypothetical protein